MKRIAIVLGALLALHMLAGSVQAFGNARVEITRRQNEFRIERRAAIQHRRTPLWNIPGHIMIEIDEAFAKAANNRAATRAQMRTPLRPPIVVPVPVPRFGATYGRNHRTPYRGRTCPPVRRGHRR